MARYRKYRKHHQHKHHEHYYKYRYSEDYSSFDKSLDKSYDKSCNCKSDDGRKYRKVLKKVSHVFNNKKCKCHENKYH